MKDTNNSTMNDVLKKLRKLQKLYEGAKEINSEGEAANAAFAIQRLLAKYNLSMEEVMRDEDKEKKEVGHEFASGFTYKSIGGQWEQRLMYVCCKYNFCKCFIYGSSYKKLLIVGKKENLEVVKWLKDMLSERFVGFSNDKWKEYKKTIQYSARPISKDKFQRSYLMGAVEGLDSKLREEQRKEKENDEVLYNKINALVVRNDAEVDNYVSNNFGKSGSYRRTRTNLDAAHCMGYEDGKNTDLYKPIQSNRKDQANDVKLLK